MAKREFTFKGKTVEEVSRMGLQEFAELLPARKRRSIKRGFSDEHSKLLKRIRAGNNVKTHCRDMIILPEMINKTIRVYNGKEAVRITIMPDMLGHYLGEFAMTRRRVMHSAPGIGATRSSASLSVR
ncbi:30S ribosomal protein S19 [Candidatus Woesearchaeota archaeon CG08_land_8_20_14_0_20_47_9]|nr:MAG: 30S ribosomal protein S19 [Candidatus Woesearchaeota archaeon CG1_02_47_18]PIN75821.1 MAG: 30S ribosomal protein S19 [Candidatus Woesearchaeota archaeon CG10_big_fil_rev_8_21_14_0_10_47_5]PIO04167.1 MAG: 30S ribosomal protein S19 [Candidatus Woesearchaeota archaeon CG08_land_8_20_14_0_20_47_9]HII29777.1 30S ribosomal protein S19 [Candidatus Woesearchaeota archaeon]